VKNHTISIDELTNYTPEIIIASSSSSVENKMLKAIVHLISKTILYQVINTDKVVVVETLEEAIKEYNEI